MRTRYKTSGGKIRGIAHYLSGQAELSDVVYQTNIGGGHIIPNPTNIVNPTILLDSPRFNEMLEGLKKEYDYILIATPPLGSVADAMNIAVQCDGTLLAIHSGATPRSMVFNAVKLLERTRPPLLGVVLNRVEIKHKSGRYYSRYYGHYYGGYGYGGQEN